MKTPIDQSRSHVDDRISGQHAVLHRSDNSFFHGGDILARDGSADDAILEFESGTRIGRLEIEYRVAVLTATAGLPDEFAYALGGDFHGLAVSDLWAPDIRADMELAGETVHEDFEVQFAHSGDNRLTGLLIGVDLEGRVFLEHGQFADERVPVEAITFGSEAIFTLLQRYGM